MCCFVAEQSNPVGDAAYHPFTPDDRVRVLGDLLGAPDMVADIRRQCAALPETADARDLLRALGSVTHVH
ncbi:hypothetical protein AB0L88_36790 [Saccharopolyspora shandongensis]|uniref:hypothetical protein n=1 Tax=Saccharopolyspora shandongensis TaxID=418495 RepID=UPI00343A187B